MKNIISLKVPGKSKTCAVQLFQMNNLQLGNMDLEPFDIITCDGPYGIWPEYGWPDSDWDNFDLNVSQGREEFKEYYRKLFTASLKYLKDTGSLFVFNYPEGANLINIVLYEFPVHFRRWISWIYDNHFDFDRGTNFARSHETILYYTKNASNFIFHDHIVKDCFFHPLIKIESNQFNEGAKPLKVVEFLLDVTNHPGGRLLSLFAGTGTDLIAASKYDMDSVGFEFNADNFQQLVGNLAKK